MILKLTSNSPTNTEKIGYNLGKRLKGGEIIELASDLGGGKTTFVRGVAAGAGSQDKVASPSFTLNRLYKCPNFEINHFDFYRLNDAGVMAHELADIVNDSESVVIIEWAGVVESVLPSEKMEIKIRVPDIDSRQLIFNYPASMSYLLSDYVDTNNSHR